MSVYPVQLTNHSENSTLQSSDQLSPNKMSFLAKKICEYEKQFLNTCFTESKWNLSNEECYLKPEAITMDAIASGYINQWFADRHKESCETFVISIGSNKSEEQCTPSFIKDKKNVAILNIDRSFSAQQFVDTAFSNSCKMRFQVDKTLLPRGYISLSYAIFKTLELGKRVILIDSTAPTGFEKFSSSIVNFINASQEHLGTNFAYVQSFFGCYPVAVLNKDFFCEFESKGLGWAKNSLLDIIWPLQSRDFRSTIQAFQQTELNKTVKENNLSRFGLFFSDLKDVRMEDLFKESSCI